MVWVKICGNTNLPDAQAAVEAGADALGFIFAESPRRIESRTAKQIVEQLPRGVERVGVFVNQDPAQVARIAGEARLTALQLHGDEDLTYVAGLRRELGRKRVRIFKTLSLEALAVEAMFGNLQPRQHVDALLVDSGTAKHRGGTGKTFNWKEAAPLLQSLARRWRIIVAGGLNAENVASAIETLRPWGIDAVSSLESEPGKKDLRKLRAFLRAAKA